MATFNEVKSGCDLKDCVIGKFFYNIDPTIPRSLKSDQSYYVEIDPETHGFKSAFGGMDNEGIDMSVVDGRNLQITVDEYGFQLSPCNFCDLDFTKDTEILTKYYPQTAEYVKQTLGAYKVYSYAHMVRRSTAGQYAVEGDVRVGGVALTVHNDYAMLGAPVRMENFFKPPRTNDSFRPLGDAPLIPPDEYEDLSKRRWAFINVWRNLADYPIVDTPLAMVDAKTFDKNDLLTLDFRYVDATIETYIAAHNPKHRWIYFPNMTKHEAILLKTYDSQGALFQDEHNYPPYHKDEPPVPASFAIHSAFRNPLAPPDYPPRYSIEVRTVVFY